MRYTLLKAVVFAALMVCVYPATCTGDAVDVCKECESSDTTKCSYGQCKERYFYNATETTGCEKCAVENCKRCTSDECKDCMDNYELDEVEDKCNYNFGSYLFYGLGILLSLLIFI